MELTHQNYFSKEADLEYMSVSQYKLFRECEAKALATIQGQEDATYKTAFLEGELFEALVSGDANLFKAQHPELLSTRGATAGQIKSEFKKVINASEKFNDQVFFRDIIDRCEKQIVLTGEIKGIKVKCMLDLFDKKTNSIYDIKCMKDFKEQWNKDEKAYMPWYYTYGYVLQLAVYREIVRQNFGEPKEIGLIAATKEEIPDIQALSFDSSLLDLELEDFKNNVERYDKIKKGIEEPVACTLCSYCKEHKVIDSFKEVK